MFQRTVISSPAPAVTYSQLVAGIFAFAKNSKSARQIGSAPDAHSRATGSSSFRRLVAACAFDLDSSAIPLRSRIPAPPPPHQQIQGSEYPLAHVSSLRKGVRAIPSLRCHSEPAHF